MNGGSPPALTAAASNAGALGSCAAALLSPSSIIDTAKTLRTLTDKPFNMNLFLLDPVASDANVAYAQNLLRPFRDELGLAPALPPKKFSEDCRDQIAALLEAAPPVASFTFGILSADVVAQFKRAGSLVIGTATTVTEARAWEQVGADFVCVRPFEASIPPYPIQNALTADMRQAAAKQNRPEFMSLWAGQGVSMGRPMPAAQLVETLADELAQALCINA